MKKMRYSTVLLAVFAVILQSEARHLDKCQLVRELRQYGFPEHELASWVCLVEHESSGNTNAVGTLNQDGSKDFGLFQINDRYWCNNSNWPGKECNVTCNDLISDDITKAVACAKKIYSVHGFRAWYGWITHCQGALPDISQC